jgi:hypothetical protein
MSIHKNAQLTPEDRHVLVERNEQQDWSIAQAAQAAGLSTRQARRRCSRDRSGDID